MVENITWKEIMEADIDQLHHHCTEFGLSDRGDEDILRERLLRHILSISLPAGEILLQGKVNINAATADEMRLWPYMGDTLIRNIIAYRKMYDRFYKVEDLLNVKGVGDNLFKRLSNFVDVSGKTHIKVARGVRAEADLELIKLEDDIRQKAWEIRNLQDGLQLDMESLAGTVTDISGKEKVVTQDLKTLNKLTSRLDVHEKRMKALRQRLQKKHDHVRELESIKKQEIADLKKEHLQLEKVLPWKSIILADLEELQSQCEQLGLSDRGDEASLRDRLMRHILSINLPLGEFLLDGKLNINTASPEEMSLWPYMGDTLVKNIVKYRNDYERFNKVEDLLNVKGVGDNLFRKLVQFVDISGKTHIKVKRGTRADADMALIKLEDDIRNKAWELENLRDTTEIEISGLVDLTRDLDYQRNRIRDDLGELEEAQARLLVKEKELEQLKSEMDGQFENLSQLRQNTEDAYENILDLKEEAEKNREMLDTERGELAEMRSAFEDEKKSIGDERMALDDEIKSIEDERMTLDDEKKSIEDERMALEEEKKSIEDERMALDNEKEEIIALREKLEESKGAIMEDSDAQFKNQEEFENKLKALEDREQNLDDQLKAIQEKEDSFDSRSRELDDREQGVTQKEQDINEVADRIGLNLKDLNEKTVDIPVMVPSDPDDTNPEDDRVILKSTDGLIQKSMNVYYEGEKIDDVYSRVVIKNVPTDKSYNILVDTGERKYFLIKNFNPGGEA
jgi:competence ComEA-like helix-hairpin-helix protein